MKTKQHTQLQSREVIQKTIASNLKKAIEKSGTKQKDIAGLLNVSDSLVSKWVNGQSDFNQVYAHQLCLILNISANSLLDVAGSMSESIEISYGSIKWIESSLNYRDGDIFNEAETGILLFRKMLIDESPMIQCLNYEPFKPFAATWANLSRTFRVAISSGALRITHVDRDEDKEKELKKIFGDKLWAVRVANIPKSLAPVIKAELIAFTAARTAFPLNPGHLAIGPGFTMLRMIEQTIPNSTQYTGTEWIPLVIEKNVKGYGAYPSNFNAARLAQRHPRSTALYCPFVSPNQRGMQLITSSEWSDEERYAIKASANLDIPRVIFCSIGSGGSHLDQASPTEFISSDGEHVSENFLSQKNIFKEKEVANQVVVEQLGLFLDENAEEIEIEEEYNILRDKVFTVNLTRLKAFCKHNPLWVVATGEHKKKAVLTAIRHGTANSLVIDTDIAEYLCENGLS